MRDERGEGSGETREERGTREEREERREERGDKMLFFHRSIYALF